MPLCCFLQMIGKMYHLYKHTSGNVSVWREIIPPNGTSVKEWEFISYAMAANLKAVATTYTTNTKRPAYTFNHEPPVENGEQNENAACLKSGVLFSSDSLDEISKEVFLLAL
jgi:hypothetical protein